ncbi:MAG: hypothetical protein QNJ66_17500 [Crocosphaera sp.]|nr:hypothetical protein [Crocosphaera sp.]
MLKQPVKRKILKFLLGGSLAALINIIMMIILIKNLGFNSPILHNIANIISIEISLVTSFFIYRLLVTKTKVLFLVAWYFLSGYLHFFLYT